MRNLCHTCRPFHIMRAVYYRLYTKEGPLESNNPIFSNDRFISRISSKSVRPPHTAPSLKRCVCKIEEVEGPEKSTLYLSLSEKKPLDDSARLGLRGKDGPGSSEVDPVVFVIDKGAAEKRPKSASRAQMSCSYGRLKNDTVRFAVLFFKISNFTLTSLSPTLRRR